MAKFDLYVVNPAVERLAQPIAGIDPALLKKRGYIRLGTELEVGRRIIRELQSFRGGAYLVPIEYREPRVSLEQARAKALEQVRVLKDRGKRLGELEEGWDDQLWWSFRIEDIEATEQDLIPGRLTISIDKLDGHVGTADEFKAWLELSGLI